jgi:hypothetical protein
MQNLETELFRFALQMELVPFNQAEASLSRQMALKDGTQ